MRRTAVVGVVVLAVVVLAAPGVRRGVGARFGSVAAGVRSRVEGFRTDYAEREAELRERLLPDDAVVAAAARTRADHH
ncbi:hypothetical protein AA0Y32_04555 [Georgenia phoenicis]|uniref:hypothetical protein n=1 Tax=unclassified Georgenia TaxID=2626815 RepID=UPI0039AF7427